MATVTITIPSNRIYLDTLSVEEVDCLKQTMFCNNRAKEHLYNIKYDNQFTSNGIGKENETTAIKQWIKETLNIRPSEYYITSLMSHTNGMISSQKELEKLYSKEHKAACEKRKKKLKTLRRRLTMCKKSKQSLIQYSKHSCNPKALYIPKDFKDKIDNINNKEQVYLYEIWLTKEIKILTARIHQIEEKDRNAKAKHENRKVPRATFGTKHFYKLKDTVKDIDMNEWHKERNFRRNNIMLFSGRFDSRYKN